MLNPVDIVESYSMNGPTKNDKYMFIVRMSINNKPHYVEPYSDKKEAIATFNSRVIEGLDFPQPLSVALYEMQSDSEDFTKILAQFIIRESLT